MSYNHDALKNQVHRLHNTMSWQPKFGEGLLTFTDAVTYQEWLAGWRKSLHQQQEQQRSLRRQLSRPHEWRQPECQWAHQQDCACAPRLQQRRAVLREQLRAMQVLRQLAKSEARRQYQARRGVHSPA